MKNKKKDINNKRYYKHLKITLINVKQKMNKIMQDQEFQKHVYKKRHKRKIKKIKNKELDNNKTNKNLNIIVLISLYMLGLFIYIVVVSFILQIIR